MADGHLNFDTKIDEHGFNEGVSKLGNLAKSSVSVIGKAMVGATAAVTAVGVAMTKASLDVVASMEQNIGGVETLFKDSADKVIENANRAFETAGMSANDYMSTVTSFSASLLQSLGGDTEKAAEYADRAIIDMSDNANKMGTSMELIQNAYQGFAKQNYTMLDNLKLGYGGTQEEMKRLIKDASKMKDVQEKLGVTVDESSMSFGNIVNAISVMQESMGIAGTTAKEAMTTIEGSTNAAKAAWENFLGGTASAEQFADTFGTAVGNIVSNLGEIVPRLMETVPEVVKAICEQFSERFGEDGLETFINAGGQLVTDLLTGVANSAPNIVNAAVQIIQSLIDGLEANLPQIITGAIQIVQSLVEGIIQLSPQLLELGMQMLIQLANGLAQALPELIPQAVNCILTLVNTLLDPNNINSLVDAGINLLLSLVDGVLNAIPLLIDAVPEIIANLLNAILANLPKLIQTGIKLTSQLAIGLIKAIPQLVSKIPQIIKSIIKAFSDVDWGKVGKDILNGIKEGLLGEVGALVDAAKDVAGMALDGIKNLLGIHSPSRVFRDEVGKMMALGMGIGFEKNIPIKSMNTQLKKAINSLKGEVAITTSASPGYSVGSMNSNPLFATNNTFDFDEYERRQRKLNKERDSRPIYLGTERIDRQLPKGAVPVW